MLSILPVNNHGCLHPGSACERDCGALEVDVILWCTQIRQSEFPFSL